MYQLLLALCITLLPNESIIVDYADYIEHNFYVNKDNEIQYDQYLMYGASGQTEAQIRACAYNSDFRNILEDKHTVMYVDHFSSKPIYRVIHSKVIFTTITDYDAEYNNQIIPGLRRPFHKGRHDKLDFRKHNVFIPTGNQQ